jgi:hypothetical protein
VDGVSDVHLGASLGHLVIDEDAALVAGVLSHGAALDESGIFEKFIYTHFVSFINNGSRSFARPIFAFFMIFVNLR